MKGVRSWLLSCCQAVLLAVIGIGVLTLIMPRAVGSGCTGGFNTGTTCVRARNCPGTAVCPVCDTFTTATCFLAGGGCACR